jgi:hypothetical protein
MTKLIFLLFFLFVAFSVFAQDASEPYFAGDQSLLIMPTAYTMPKGSSAFTDYELIVIQYSYAIGNRTHLSAMSAFPISAELMRSLTIGVKQNYFKSGMLQSAAWVSFTPDNEIRLLTFGNVFSYGTSKTSGHAAIAIGANMQDEISSAIIMVGGTTRLSNTINLMGEFMSSSEVLAEDAASGIINIGIRFKGPKLSWDLGGFRPTKGDTGDVLLLPFLKATFIF